MEKKLLAALIPFVLVFSSCSNPSIYYSVWKGNNTFVGGDYQTANTEYLKALEDGVYSYYINYNLGNVYYALGEGSAAIEEWDKAVFTGNKELLFRTMYNKGVLQFEAGNYKEAFESFKAALELKPDDHNTKVNLEYSLRRMNANLNTTESSAAGAQDSGGDEVSDEIARILEFIKRKDAAVWSAGEEKTVISGEEDW